MTVNGEGRLRSGRERHSLRRNPLGLFHHPSFRTRPACRWSRDALSNLISGSETGWLHFMKSRALLVITVSWLVLHRSGAAEQQAAPPPLRAAVKKLVTNEYPKLDALYKHFHSNPELSLHEEKTSAKLAAELGDAGFQVTHPVGGQGVVAVLRNGPGPTLLIRSDLDALPVTEQTGLSFASAVQTKDDKGTLGGAVDVHRRAIIDGEELVAGIGGRGREVGIPVGRGIKIVAVRGAAIP